MKSKEGDIAFFKNKFVTITVIEYEEVPITKKVKVGFLKHKYVETGETKRQLKQVWWKEVGNILPKEIHLTNICSTDYDWDKLVMEAKILLEQAKIILK